MLWDIIITTNYYLTVFLKIITLIMFNVMLIKIIQGKINVTYNHLWISYFLSHGNVLLCKVLKCLNKNKNFYLKWG